MTRETALRMIDEYQSNSTLIRERILEDIRSRFPDEGSEAKAMRWLGFCQGVCYQCGMFSLEELKEHSRRGYVYNPDDVKPHSPAGNL